MDIKLLEIGAKMRKGLIFTIRGCFRSVCNHPFLVGLLCFLIFLYRSSPFIFSLLVSASPILVCTAVLLGTLLSFGQPNIPEIEIEEKTTHVAVSLKTGVSGDTTIVETNESYYVKRFSEKRRDEAEQSTGQPDSPAGKLSKVLRQDYSDDTAPLIEGRSWEVELDDGEIWEANRKGGDFRYKQKTVWNEEGLNDEEVVENHYAPIAKVEDEVLESDDEKSDADSFDSEKVNVDSLDSPPRSPWTRIEEREDEEEELEEENEEGEEDALDSGSDRAESSSPDASMADIMPMLDELHPLLDEETPQPVHVSHGGSDAASERSPKSSTTSHESDDDTEKEEELEAGDDDNEDGDEEEDAQEDKEGQTKSAITWTEEDQKNLMDLGSSEIERNQRLESLILRRRARKNMGVFPERNLIELDIADLPFNITPISTRRQNPFDLPNDSYDNSGLPPIPGSAPSILLTRRNPFDIPYDSGEEKPNLTGDGFQDEFTASHSREPFFRRHESFNVRPSIFAPSRLDAKIRPYFVPERTLSEESSYSSFQRQSSGLSDSKVSSVPETESIGSVEDLEDRKLSEEDQQEVEAIPWTKEVTEEGPSGGRKRTSQLEEVIEEDVYLEPKLISKTETISEYVGHGSQSSEEEDSLELGQVDKKDVEVSGLESQLGDVADHYQQGSETEPVEVHLTGYDSNSEAVEQRHSRGSSTSSISEVSERIFTETAGEGLSLLEGTRDFVAEEPGISTQTSVESTDLSTTSSLVNDIPHREPVYDSSPREVRKNFSSSSISSDVNQESDLGLPPAVVKRTVSFIERESEGTSQAMETNITSTTEMLPKSSVAHPVDESRLIDVVHIREHDNINSDFSGFDQRSESEGSSAAPGITYDVSIPSKSSGEASEEQNLMEQLGRGEVPSSSADKHIHTLVKSSEDQNLDQSRKENLPISERESIIEVSEPLYEGQLRAEHSIGVEETVQPPNSDADVYQEADANLVSTPSAAGNLSLFHDKAIQGPIFKHLDGVQASSTPVEPSEDVQNAQKSDMPEIQDLDHDISSDLNSPISPDFTSILSCASETTSSHVDVLTTVEEVDEIKEIDEGLLSELDNVGDFSIGSNEFEKHRDSVGGSFSSAYQSETSTVRVVEVDSAEENRIEDMKCISDLHTSETGIAEHIDVSKVEFNEIDSQHSPDRETSEDEKPSKENDVHPENISGIPKEESVPKRAELESVETAIIAGSAEVSYEGHVDKDATSGMPEVEASKIEDIDLAFKHLSSREMASVETEIISGGAEASYQGQVDKDTTSGMPEVEATKFEDIDLAFKQISSREMESVETEIITGRAEASYQGQVDRDATSGMPEVEATKIEDIDQAFKQNSSTEIEKPVVLEPPQAELVVGETISEQPEDGKRVANLTYETSVLEVRPIEDATLDYKQFGGYSRGSHPRLDSVDHSLQVVESGETQETSSELHVGETLFSEGAILPPKQVLDGNTVKQLELNSDNGSVEIKDDKVGSSVEELAAEKPDHKAEAPKEPHLVEGKGKISKSSSSNDSDRE